MQEMIVKISKTGEVTVEAKGVVGKGCKDLTRNIEAAIGRVTADTGKPEMFQGNAATQGGANVARHQS